MSSAHHLCSEGLIELRHNNSCNNTFCTFSRKIYWFVVIIKIINIFTTLNGMFKLTITQRNETRCIDLKHQMSQLLGLSITQGKAFRQNLSLMSKMNCEMLPRSPDETDLHHPCYTICTALSSKQSSSISISHLQCNKIWAWSL